MSGPVCRNQRHRVADPLDKPGIVVPGSDNFRSESESSVGIPTFGAQCGYNVSTARRETGGLPLHAATRFVDPIDNPNGSYIGSLTFV